MSGEGNYKEIKTREYTNIQLAKHHQMKIITRTMKSPQAPPQKVDAIDVKQIGEFSEYVLSSQKIQPGLASKRNDEHIRLSSQSGDRDRFVLQTSFNYNHQNEFQSKKQLKQSKKRYNYK